MPRERTSMNKIREIIRLGVESGLSKRQIAAAMNMSRRPVSQYLRDYRASGLSLETVLRINDDELASIFEKKKKETSDRYRKLTEKFEYYFKELTRTGVTLDLLWEEYKREDPGGYNRTQFCHHFKVWLDSTEVTMHMEHKAGSKMFTDYTGKKFVIYEKMTGIGREVETMVAILCGSQLTYVEATESQKKEDWIKSNENALLYFEGVPGATVPDCLKSAVQKADMYEPDINPEYADFARHYGTVIIPARPGHPKDKALVENAVKIIYTRIFAPLRDRKFYSLEELNQAIRERLEIHNNTPFQRMKISRRELFNQIEKEALKPLPRERYELRKFLSLKVHYNYHILFSPDNHYYSVPYRYVGKQVTVIYTANTIEIYHKNARIASHLRDFAARQYTTASEHMPVQHQFINGWTPERMISWAEAIGPDVKEMTVKILESREHPEQAFNSTLGLLNLSKKYGHEMLNGACRRALEYECYNYRSVKNILENNSDKIKEEAVVKGLPVHENIRGSQCFT